jgi:polar amino acid transport system substrate-binding protein
MNSACATLLLAALLPTAASAAAPATVVKLASDDWCPYVCTTERRIVGGILVELAEQILAAGGYRQEPVLLPLNRAMAMTDSGALDGVYAPAVDRRLIPSEPLLFSRACFYTRADSTWQYTGMESLRTLRLGAIKDYGYDGGPFDDYLAAAAKRAAGGLELNVGVNASETNIKKMLRGRYPVAIEHEAVMNYLMHVQTAVPHGPIRQAGCLDRKLPLVIGIGKHNPAAPELLRAVNDGVKSLKASGALQRLKRRYGVED